MTDETVIESIKGFNRDLTCRGYQFAPGQTYTAKGNAKSCKNGFHACPDDLHPLTVFGFYAPGVSRYFEVEQSGDICRTECDKAASTILTVKVEISIGELTRRAVHWVWDRATKSHENHATGYQGAASATGYQGAASATGDQGAASATGDQGAASATGTQGAASATGTQGAASATGTQGAASATSTWGAASATGTWGAASATGYRGAASATGDQGAASATGTQGAASATGYQGAASATGYQGAASATGFEGRVMGAEGNAVFAVEREPYRSCGIISAACGIVGQDGIEPGIWYVCKDGKLIEARP